MRPDLKNRDSFTLEMSKNHFIRNFLCNGRLRLKNVDLNLQNYKRKRVIPVPGNLFLRGGTKWDFARSSLVSSVKMFYCDGLGQIFAKHFPNHKPSPSKS